MKISDVKKLHKGDEVYWNDPDAGVCSRFYRIKTIDCTHSSVITIEDMDGSVIECYARELSWNKGG